MKPIETEAKLIIPDQAVFDELKQLQQVESFQLIPDGIKEITDRYVDTADHHLFQAGYACRIRTGKAGKLLTLKSLTGPDSDIHRREEVEMEIPSEQAQDWPPGPASDLVGSIAGDLPLETLFNLYQTRYKYLVLLQSRKVFEFSLDIVRYSESAAADILELEVELLAAGNEADLVAFVKALRRRWSLQPQPKSKFERAYETIIKS